MFGPSTFVGDGGDCSLRFVGEGSSASAAAVVGASAVGEDPGGWDGGGLGAFDRGDRDFGDFDLAGGALEAGDLDLGAGALGGGDLGFGGERIGGAGCLEWPAAIAKGIGRTFRRETLKQPRRKRHHVLYAA